MRVLFIRHGKTEGNKKKRYIGITDEPLCREGIEELGRHTYPAADYIIVSPLRRCRETAEYIYAGQPFWVCEDLRECNFGDFEGKNYQELAQNNDYQRWIDSQGTLPFPNGEAHEDFTARCCNAFQKIVCACQEDKTAALVVHGGTIMSILERYARPQKGFYDYQVENGGCIAAEYSHAAQELTVQQYL